jgi:hypothetical protein
VVLVAAAFFRCGVLAIAVAGAVWWYAGWDNAADGRGAFAIGLGPNRDV